MNLKILMQAGMRLLKRITPLTVNIRGIGRLVRTPLVSHQEGSRVRESYFSTAIDLAFGANREDNNNDRSGSFAPLNQKKKRPESLPFDTMMVGL